jgi:hypothetical protein
VSALSKTIKAALTEIPMQFAEVIDDHRNVPWRDFLKAWGEIRIEDILKRDDIGRYFIEGGAAEAIAAATKAE